MDGTDDAVLAKRHKNQLGVMLARCLMLSQSWSQRLPSMNSILNRALLLTALLVVLTSCGAEAASASWPCRPDDAEDDIQPGKVTLVPGGIEIRDAANATLWHPTGSAKAPYRLSMRVQTTNLALHPHGAGLVFGGSDVDGDKQAYTYFLVRGDGHFLVKTRDGEDTTYICPWKEHDAVTKEDSDLWASNVLTVTIDADETRFLVNGTEVYKHSSKELHTMGKYGVRLVHDLNVRFDQIEVTPGTE